MAKIISIRLDDALYARLRAVKESRNMKNMASLARDLLRRGVGAISSEGDAGFQEGVYRGMAVVHEKLQELRKEDFE